MKHADHGFVPPVPAPRNARLLPVKAAPRESAPLAGHPLDSAARGILEPRFGRDFSDIRVHRDAHAAEATRASNARAFATGKDLFFDAGQYQPATRSGLRLLAHELAHTLQQEVTGAASKSAAEKDARGAAGLALTGGAARVGPAAGAVQHQPKAGVEPEPQADTERAKIVETSQRSKSSPQSRAWEIGWRMLSRYFPEYSPHVSGVAYQEKEPGVRVDLKESELHGKKTESATVTVGRRFVDDTSEDTLRDRIEEMRAGLSKMKPDTDPQKGPGLASVKEIIGKHFPKKGHRLSSVEYDAKLPGVTTEFRAGGFLSGKAKVDIPAPRLYFGKEFLAIPNENDRVAKIGAQLAKVDKWCVENGLLTKLDLEDEDIRLRIRGLGSAQLTRLRDKAQDGDVRAFAGSLLGTSAPLEKGLADETEGSKSVTIGNVKVVILPHVFGSPQATATGADTDFKVSARPAIPFKFDGSGKVTTFTAPPPNITVTIQTGYGSAADPSGPSGYGRGTTEKDRALGAASLRVHEGSHALDYVDFIKEDPFPKFGGHEGMTKARFEAAVRDFDTARKDWAARMKAFSVRRTDCTGITIDEYNQQHKIQAPAVCK